MLVLTRRTGEQIIIRDDIQISVLQVSRTKVRLGIVAPSTVSVQRQEVGHRQRREPAMVGSDGESFEGLIVELDRADFDAVNQEVGSTK